MSHISAICKRYGCRSCTDPHCVHSCHEPTEPMFGPTEPQRPYTQDGEPSAGYSGTDTSRHAEPIRAASQQTVFEYVTTQGMRGATVKEVREATGLHHGVASGALSVLHKNGYLWRLTDKRLACRVYIHPLYCPAGVSHD